MSGPDITTTDVTGPDFKINRKKNLFHYSSFHITISSNQKPTTNDQAFALRDSMREALSHLYNDEENVAKLLKFLDGSNWESNKDKIESIETKFSVERGHDDRGARIHSHAIMHIKHRTKLHIKIAFIRKFMKEHMNLENVYINVQYVDTARRLEDYVAKEGLDEGVVIPH